MPYVYVGVRLFPNKFETFKKYDLNYDTTTVNAMKKIIMLEMLRKKNKSEEISKISEIESKEKKFKSEDNQDEDMDVSKQYLKYTEPDSIDLVYCGKRLADENTLSSYNIKDYVMIHVFNKNKFVIKLEEEPKEKLEESSSSSSKEKDGSLQTNIVMVLFKRLGTLDISSLDKLRKPENMKKVLDQFPDLKKDPVALAFIQDPYLLSQLNGEDPIMVEKIIQKHPALCKSIVFFVDLLYNEKYKTPTTSSLNSPYMSGDEEMDITSQPTTSGEQRITQDQVAAAIASATNRHSASQSDLMMRLVSSLPNPSPTISPSSSTSGMASMIANQMQQFTSQMQQMREMGLSDDAINLQALQITNGDVEAAINLVFSGTLSGEN